MSKPGRDYLLFIEDILDAIRKIERYVRNVLIHNYFGIDVEAVWDTVHNNIPILKDHVEEVFRAEQ